jgi:hypothetical protein
MSVVVVTIAIAVLGGRRHPGHHAVLSQYVPATVELGSVCDPTSVFVLMEFWLLLVDLQANKNWRKSSQTRQVVVSHQ